MSTLLRTLFGYQAWADLDLFDTLEQVDPDKNSVELKAALRLVCHCHVVSRIFAGHLQGIPHGFTSDNLEEPPPLSELRSAVTFSDQWYRDYVYAASPETLSERVAFTFTDGDRGHMTREEMLIHVVLHGGYHRGEVGRILGQIAVVPPWDTFAVHLHQSDPHRRCQGRARAVSA